ncbi:aldehyde dehydrogenase [Jiella sp. M17.18]|uniref:aldehyde dehydrogenase n=1 Tax=Jiella sp. M17.18 TaxID=3234247 RepID=UPI0034E02D01
MNDTIPSREMLIDGRFRDAGETRPVINPATGEAFAEVALADAAMTAEAIAAARRAQPAWGALAPLERAGYMRRIAAAIRSEAEAYARLIVREQGKPINEARGEVDGAAGFFDFFAEYARRIQGEILPSDHAGEQIWIQRVPIGVVGAIIPWNYPFALVARKVAPALIAGDTIVLKSHEDTPLSALAMARIFQAAGLPAGVVNILTGTGAVVGEALCNSADLDLITMTGSVPTGKRIMGNAAKNLTPVSLELGGKAPFIVMADSDVDMAVRSAVTSRYMNCGQVCICNERTYVERSVYDEFVEKFVAASKALRIGDPMEDSTDLGPKISRAELEKVEARVAEAVGEGAEIVIGGGRPENPPHPGGFYYSPTVITGVRPGMGILKSEVFGPVVPIMPFDSFDEAVSHANDGRYGLSAYLFTNDIAKIMRTVNEVAFGEIYVNRVGPESLQGFHVGYHDSGLGGDDGSHGLETYLRKKTVYVNYSGAPTSALMPYGG